MSGVCGRAVRGAEEAGRVVVVGEAGEGHEVVHLGGVSLGWKRGSEELTFDGNVMRSATVLRWSAVQPGGTWAGMLELPGEELRIKWRVDAQGMLE